MSSVTEQLQMVIKAEGQQAIDTLDTIEKEIAEVRKSTDEATSSSTTLTTAQDQNNNSLNSLGSTLLSTISKYVSIGAAVRQYARFLTEANAAAEEENIGFARLQAVIEATGRSAETSALQIDAMADKLELLTNADKQAVMDAAASLAIMENVSTDLFERIFSTANDLYQVVGSDISSAILTIGRAMEDPIEGMTRLRRQGIFISDEIETQITGLVEQNRLYDAQVLLLDSIQSKVAGTAEAIAENAQGKSLATAIDRYIGSVGQTVNKIAAPITETLADIVNFFTGPFDSLNDIINLLSIRTEDFEGKSLGELQDYMDLYERSLEDPNLAIFDGWIGIFEQKILPSLSEQIELQRKAYEIEQERKQATAEQAAQEEERKKAIEAQQEATKSILDLYNQTDEGQLESIKESLEALQSQYESDKQALITETDEEVRTLIQQRIPLYEAVIAAKHEELKNLTDISDKGNSATQGIVEKILGMSASEFVLSIPISYDFGRTELETVEEQLSVLKSTINQLWRQKPEEELDSWNSAVTILSDKYEELSDKAEELKKEQEASAHIDTLKATATKELNSLLSDEEKARNTLNEYETALNELLENKLITQEEYNELLDRQTEKLGLSAEKVSDMDKALQAVETSFENFIKQSFSIEAISREISGIFETWGTAIVSGENSIDTVSSAIGDWVQDLTSQLSTLFISAGLRIIIDGGLAGLAPGIALMAMGGITGISAGMMGGSSAAISDDILKSMQDEMEARQKLADSINDTIDTEYDLLKRQLERNLIGEEEFISKANGLQQERDLAEARVQIAQSLYNGIQNLNSEYQSMNGWDKFWSGRDEDIKKEIENLRNLLDSVDTATTDELRDLVNQLKSLGLSTGSIPSFAEGGEFTTNGPQLILVGDNVSGREHVSIEPLNYNQSPSQQGNMTVIQILGNVYGWEDLYSKLQQIGLKIERRKRA